MNDPSAVGPVFPRFTRSTLSKNTWPTPPESTRALDAVEVNQPLSIVEVERSVVVTTIGFLIYVTPGV
jgi:hypothetical protein